ncbi:hypothetical protein E2C01_028863 [Portunus trituberculatus]|uniref:Uncharacterized protein n=1 Tax=Portunus trituberculatus TaxID=210409 RepID=A0A5B7ELT5_PORTR|nr:hypothetical protein [Portunus trituberculatus]
MMAVHVDKAARRANGGIACGWAAVFKPAVSAPARSLALTLLYAWLLTGGLVPAVGVYPVFLCEDSLSSGNPVPASLRGRYLNTRNRLLKARVLRACIGMMIFNFIASKAGFNIVKFFLVNLIRVGQGFSSPEHRLIASRFPMPNTCLSKNPARKPGVLRTRLLQEQKHSYLGKVDTYSFSSRGTRLLTGVEKQGEAASEETSYVPIALDCRFLKHLSREVPLKQAQGVHLCTTAVQLAGVRKWKKRKG